MRRLVTFFLVVPLLGAVTAPAAAQSPTATEEPTTSVRTDILPGMALTIEEVEPGVYKIINDGVRDIAKTNNLDVVVGHDGGIRLLRPMRFFRLGSDEVQTWATRRSTISDFEVAPGGTIWTIQTPQKGGRIEHPVLRWREVDDAPRGLGQPSP